MEPQVTVSSFQRTAGPDGFAGVPLCTLHVPNSLLLDLYQSSDNVVERVNQHIKGQIVTLDPECARLTTSVRRTASKLANKMRRCSGSRGRDKIRGGTTEILVGTGETISVESVQVSPQAIVACEQG